MYMDARVPYGCSPVALLAEPTEKRRVHFLRKTPVREIITEVLQVIRESDKTGSNKAVLDEARTAMGLCARAPASE